MNDVIAHNLHSPDAGRELYSLEAEQSVIGGLLLDNDAYDRVADVVNVDDFYAQAHRTLYAAILGLIDSGKAVDVVTLSAALKQSGAEDRAGGLAYLGEIVANVPTAANVRHYATLVRERRIERDMIILAGKLGELARGKEPLAQRADEAQSLVLQLAEQTIRRDARKASVIAREFMDVLESRYNSGNEIHGLSTGLHDLDKKLGGMKPGQSIVVAGRPGMGKSALADGIALHVASHGTPAAIITLEMSDVETIERVMANAGRIDGEKLRSGKIAAEDWEAVSLACAKMSDLPLWIDDSPNASIDQVCAKARRMRRLYGIGLLVIDYLQLMSGPKDVDSRREEVDVISRRIKLLAKELGIPIIALSQLNRSLEQRANKRPMMADLRESGAIEQDADVILFVYRDEVYNEDTQDRGIAEIDVAKQRNGPTGMVRSAWLPEYYAFADLAFEYVPKIAPPASKRLSMKDVGL